MANYKKIEVVLKGEGAGLLMNSAESMVEEESSTTKNPTKKYDKVGEAEKKAYRNDKGELVIPARCIKASILNAASWIKFGRKAAKPIIAGTTRIGEAEVVLLDLKGKPIKDYKIDLRPVVVNRGSRIIRARPLIKDWVVKFDIIYNSDLLEPEHLRGIIEDAGQRVGVLDNRPQKLGENGLFTLEKFLPKKE